MNPSLVVALMALTATGAGPEEDFEKHIRPLFVNTCVKCHGPEKMSGGLRLDSREALLKGGESGPAVVAGKPLQSLLVRAVSHTGDLKMPPKAKLSDKEIEAIALWIAQGAVWPGSGKLTGPQSGKFQVTKEQSRWWAFQPVAKVTVPPVKNSQWAKNDLDRFILADLEKQARTPAQAAAKRVLLRRVTQDLTGLPPTLEEVEAFLRDQSAEAFVKVVDRLLASPAYGQRFARLWLDVVRYADYHDGNPKARNPICEPLEAYRYRDWVVRSLNQDLPFDQFIVHQIAGDLLPSPDGKEPYANGLIATSVLVNGAWDRGDADKEKMVSDMVDDQIDLVGKSFMGLTMGCARCHDHKFDPVSQNDYYGLAGIFYSTRMLFELGTKGGEITLQRRALVSKEVVDKRAQQVKQLAEWNTKLAELDKKAPKPSPTDPERKKLVDQRDRLQKELLPEPPMTLSVSEGGVPGGLFPKIQDVPVHIRGSYTRLGPVVPRRMPEFFAGDKQPSITKGSGRQELANWVVSKTNPLTARVIVNRVWQWHFGTGLVRTPNNFGILSEPPSHPGLLDWLTTKFVEEGWSLKKLHRFIVLSATYQQSSVVSLEQVALDPENRWLGRFSPRRLDAEAIRDSMLFVTGRLDLTPEGPATDNLNTPRRSLYVQTARWDRNNFGSLFDAANPDAAVEKRDTSTVAPQALFLLNHDFVTSQAGHLADKVMRKAAKDNDARIRCLFELTFSRPPSDNERDVARGLLNKLPNGDPVTILRDLAHVLLCANEFVYLD